MVFTIDITVSAQDWEEAMNFLLDDRKKFVRMQENIWDEKRKEIEDERRRMEEAIKRKETELEKEMSWIEDERKRRKG